MLFEPDEAAEVAGVPAIVLRRWAWLGVGPENSGTRWRPRFDDDDLMRWKQLCADSFKRRPA